MSTKISARRGAPSEAGPRSDARSITLRCTAAGGARDSPPNVPGRSRFDTARARGGRQHGTAERAARHARGCGGVTGSLNTAALSASVLVLCA